MRVSSHFADDFLPESGLCTALGDDLAEILREQGIQDIETLFSCLSPEARAALLEREQVS